MVQPVVQPVLSKDVKLNNPATKALAVLAALAVLPAFIPIPVNVNIILTASLSVFVGCWRSVKATPPEDSLSRSVSPLKAFINQIRPLLVCPEKCTVITEEEAADRYSLMVGTPTTDAAALLPTLFIQALHSKEMLLSAGCNDISSHRECCSSGSLPALQVSSPGSYQHNSGWLLCPDWHRSNHSHHPPVCDCCIPLERSKERMQCAGLPNSIPLEGASLEASIAEAIQCAFREHEPFKVYAVLLQMMILSMIEPHDSFCYL